MKLEAKDIPQIPSLSTQQKAKLSQLLKTEENSPEYIEFETRLIGIAFSQKTFDMLQLPNQTELKKHFVPIKNHLKKINKQLEGVSGDGLALLDHHYGAVTEGKNFKFEKEIELLEQSIDRYLTSLSSDDDGPQGQFADSVVPIANLTQKSFPTITIKAHRNSTFHAIIAFYFHELLNKPKSNYEYHIRQALKN